jgi:deoxyribodipyrimidine photolyase
VDTAVVLFTRDLRVHDNPALAGAGARARQVVPLFVVDPALTGPANRARFLAGSVAVLRDELRELGGGHYRVFTPYWHAWSAARWRRTCPAPQAVALPPGIEPGPLPAPEAGGSPGLAPGGEHAGRDQARA